VREQCMHTSSRILTTLIYLFPWIGRTMRPMLEKKGARTKARIKAERKSTERENTEKKVARPQQTNE
jgi:hypothetical protein